MQSIKKLAAALTPAIIATLFAGAVFAQAYPARAVRVDMMVAVMGGAMPFVNDKRLKAIAVAGKSRAAIYPD